MAKQIQVPNLTAIIGEYGSGKSLYSLELGLALCEKYHKRLACNIQLDYDALIFYCKSQGYDWLVQTRPFFYYGHLDSSALLEFKNSVIICDEAGSLFHARFWKNTTKDFLIRLAQIRKLNIHLLLTYQYPEQIDKVFREQTQHFVLCYATTKYDRKLNLPRLLTRSRYHFDRRRFEQYEFDNVFRNHPIKPKLASLLYTIDCPPLAWLLAEFRKFIITLFYAFDPVPLSQFRNRLLLKSDRFTLLFRCFNSSLEIAIADNTKSNLSSFCPLNKPKRGGITAPPSILFTVRCIENHIT